MEEEAEYDSDEVQREKRPKVIAVTLPFACTVEVPFASHRAAQMTCDALSVDQELTPDKVTRELSVRDNVLVVEIRSTEQRLLRASLTSFFDMAMTATRFLCEFDDGQA